MYLESSVHLTQSSLHSEAVVHLEGLSLRSTWTPSHARAHILRLLLLHHHLLLELAMLVGTVLIRSILLHMVIAIHIDLVLSVTLETSTWTAVLRTHLHHSIALCTNECALLGRLTPLSESVLKTCVHDRTLGALLTIDFDNVMKLCVP